ncbi:MAG: hypothetical protein Q9200_002737 [Gallowayella weberi]
MSATIDAKAIEQLPPSLLQSQPAGSPPPGVLPNFGDPPTLVPPILGVGTSFLALALFCFSIRAWTKLTIIRKFSWDDCADVLLGFWCDKGALGRHVWDVPLGKALGQASAVVSTPAVPNEVLESYSWHPARLHHHSNGCPSARSYQVISLYTILYILLAFALGSD